MRERGVTLRTYMAVQVMIETDCHWTTAVEAVATTELDKPHEYPWHERKTWDEWSAHFAALEAAKEEA